MRSALSTASPKAGDLAVRLACPRNQNQQPPVRQLLSARHYQVTACLCLLEHFSKRAQSNRPIRDRRLDHFVPEAVAGVVEQCHPRLGQALAALVRRIVGLDMLT